MRLNKMENNFNGYKSDNRGAVSPLIKVCSGAVFGNPPETKQAGAKSVWDTSKLQVSSQLKIAHPDSHA